MIRSTTGLIVYLLLGSGCRQQTAPATAVQYTQSYRAQLEKHRSVIQDQFKSKESPLPEAERGAFSGVRFFPIDSNWKVVADYTPMNDGPVFKMQSTGGRADMYQTAGVLRFVLQDTACVLEMYKNITFQQEGGGVYFFIPFYDRTNGVETYGGGRYLEPESITGTTMVLDFNKAYQPYCFYNHAYSCPIPPPVNTLPVAVKAGEKM